MCVKVTEQEGIISVVTPYSRDFVKKAHELNGRWDSAKKSWNFSIDVKDALNKALSDIYGDNGTEVARKYKARALVNLNCLRGAVCLGGRAVCTAMGRDSGAKPSEGVSLIEGKIESGGSIANWCTIVDEGATFIIPLTDTQFDKADMERWLVEPFDSDNAKTEEIAEIKAQIAKLKLRLIALGCTDQV